MTTAIPHEGLRALFATLTGHAADRVIWAGEPIPHAGPHKVTGKTGMIVLDVIARRAIGVDDEVRDYPDADTTRITKRGHRRITLQVTAEEYGDDQEGYDVLEDVRLELGSMDTDETLTALGVAIESFGDVRPIDRNVNNRAVTFASLEVFLNQGIEKVTTKLTSSGDTYIDTVELAGEDDDLDRITTFEVDGSP